MLGQRRSLLTEALQRTLAATVATNKRKDWTLPSITPPLSQEDRHFLQSHTIQDITQASPSNDFATNLIKGVISQVATDLVEQHIDKAIADAQPVKAAGRSIASNVSPTPTPNPVQSPAASAVSDRSNPGNFSIRATSNTSGRPCTFMGGMQAAIDGCVNGLAAGAISKSNNRKSDCIVEGVLSVTRHTLGCLKINEPPPNAFPTPSYRR